MSSAIVIGVGASIIGSGVNAYMQGEAAKDAAAEAGDAQMYAARLTEQWGNQARLDNILLNSMGLQDYATGVRTNVNAIIQGTANTERILHQTTGNADYLLWHGSENAQRAILGLPPAGSPGSESFAGATGTGANAGTAPGIAQTSQAYGERFTGNQFADSRGGAASLVPYQDYQPTDMTTPIQFQQPGGPGSVGSLGGVTPTNMGQAGAGGVQTLAGAAAGPEGYQQWGQVGPAGQRIQTAGTGAPQWTAAGQGGVEYVETSPEGDVEVLSGTEGMFGTQTGTVRRYTGEIDPETGEEMYTTETLYQPTDATNQLMYSPLGSHTFEGERPLGIAPAQIQPAQAGPSYAGYGGTGILQARADVERGAAVAGGAIGAGLASAQGQLAQGRGAIDRYAREAIAALGGGAGGGGAGYYRRGGGGNFSGGAAERFVLQGVPPAAERATAAIGEFAQKAVGELEVFASVGESAMREAGALSGALGADAQRTAIQSFVESPGQAFLRERQEQALLRNQAAIGGLGGGNVRTALQEQAAGIAATQQQQQIQNMLAVAAQGQQAAGQQGGFWSSAGAQSGDVLGGVARQQVASAGGIASSRIAAQAQAQVAAMQLEAQNDRAIADILGTAGVNVANLFQTGAGYDFTGGQNLADIATGAGTNLANLAQAGGLQLANVISNTAAQRAGLQTGLGTDLGNLFLGQGAQVGALWNQLGQGAATIRGNVGTTLGNIATQTGSGMANYVAGAGEYGAAGTLGQANAWGQAIDAGAQGAGALATNFLRPSQVSPTQQAPQPTGSGVSEYDQYIL